MSVTVIKDMQRLDELTEWCRNKPEDAAVRIMHSEGLSEEVGKLPSWINAVRVPVDILEVSWGYDYTKTYKFQCRWVEDWTVVYSAMLDKTPIKINGELVKITSAEGSAGVYRGEVICEKAENKTKKAPETPTVAVTILERSSRIPRHPYVLPEPTIYKVDAGSTSGFRILAKSYSERTPVRITDGCFDILVEVIGCSCWGVFEARAVRVVT